MMDPKYIEKTPYGLGFSAVFFQDSLRNYFADPNLEVISATYSPSASDKMAWSPKFPKAGEHPIGVQRYELSFKTKGTTKTLFVIAKSKISDARYLQVISGAFEKCGIKPDRPVIDYLSQLEFAHLNLKEVAIYNMQRTYPAFRDNMPWCYGTFVDDKGDICVIIMQYLEDDWLSLNPFDTSKWDQSSVELMIDALAAMHAVWYRRDKEVAKINGFENVLTSEKMQRFMPYWQALVNAASATGLPFLTPADNTFHQHIIDTIPTWRGAIDAMDKTLTQNDCVPKNTALENKNGIKKVYIYDWEIATVHVPQRDPAEFLSYVLPENFDLQLLTHYMERHRTKLEQATNSKIDGQQWKLGFKYAAQDFLLQRVLPQLPFEKLEARNIKKVYQSTRRMIELLS